MAKQSARSVEGKISEVLGGGMFRVLLEMGQEILCHPSGKMRMHNINILNGDDVTVEMSPYDLTKGRIVKRTIPGRK